MKHRNINESLRIKKIDSISGVAIVERIDEPKETNIHGQEQYQVYICDSKYLRLDETKEPQLNLFAK